MQDTSTRPIRLWPGVAAVAVLFLARFGIKAAVPGIEVSAAGNRVKVTTLSEGGWQ